MPARPVTLGRYAVTQCLRRPAFVGLLAVLPVAFVLVTMETTAQSSLPVYTYVDGLPTGLVVPIPTLHGTVIAAVTVALLTGIAGLLLGSAAADTDARLRLAGYAPLELFGGRLGALALVAAVATATVGATVFQRLDPGTAWWYLLGLFWTGLAYGLVGLLVGSVLSRTAGMYVLFFAPFLDIGVFQDPLFVRGSPEWWMRLFPGHYPLQMLFDAGFTPGIDTTNEFLFATAYLLVLASVALVVVDRSTSA